MFSETSFDYQRTKGLYILENRALSERDLAITIYSKSFLSVVPVITSPFIPEFNKMVEEEGYLSRRVFSIEETGPSSTTRSFHLHITPNVK